MKCVTTVLVYIYHHLRTHIVRLQHNQLFNVAIFHPLSKINKIATVPLRLIYANKVGYDWLIFIPWFTITSGQAKL